MTRCANCGAERRAELCDGCGLTAPAAEIVFRRRLLHTTAVFLLGTVAFLPAGHLYPPLDLDWMLIFLGAVAAVTLALAVWLDRRARRRAEFALLRRIFRALVPVPWLLAGLLFVNGQLDPGPPRERTTRVVGKFTMPGLLGSSRLVVVSWRAGRRVERVVIRREEFPRYTRDDAVILVVQPGLLGIPWVSSVLRR